MIVLGIETSQRVGSVALRLADGEILHRPVAPSPDRKHAQALVPEIQSLLAEAQITAADCDAVAVSVGPGSFTGLRIGVVCAKTFAYATGCSVLAVDTLHCIAANIEDAAAVWTIADAQRNELFVASYEFSKDEWKATQDVEIHPAESWCRTRSVDDIVIGPAVSRYRQTFESAGCRLRSDDENLPSATKVVELAAKRFGRGETDDVWALEPRYHRRSAAEEKAARAAAQEL